MTEQALVSLHYGPGRRVLRIPEERRAVLVRPWHGPPEDVRPVEAALQGPAAQALGRAVAGRRVCVLVPDATRRTPFGACLPELLDVLAASASVRLAVCTGTHSPDGAANRLWLESLAGLGVDVLAHDCRRADLREHGRTARGTPVSYNAATDEAEVFVALSDVKVHYFAGYSNPVKNLVPGLCAYETVEANHRWALDAASTYGRHPWHPDGQRRDNPLAADQVEALDRILAGRPFYALVTVGAEGQAGWAALGPAREVTPAAFLEADAHNAHHVTPTRYCIVSPGGDPDDVDLYIAQRALELTQVAVADGGEILFLAACPGGVGEAHTHANFYERLLRPLDRILADAAAPYVLFGHKPIKFARLLQRIRRLWVHSEIAPDTIRALHMTPAPDPQAVVDGWLREDDAARISVIDGANKIALYAVAGESG